MDEVISLTVVLPLLPATPTTTPAKRCAPALRGARQRRLAVGHLDQRQRRAGHRTIHHRGDGTRRRGRSDEIVAVEARTAQREIDLAIAQRARVGAHAGVGMILAGEASRRKASRNPAACDSCRTHPGASRTTCLVAERATLAADDLHRLMALAGDQHHVAGARLAASHRQWPRGDHAAREPALRCRRIRPGSRRRSHRRIRCADCHR